MLRGRLRAATCCFVAAEKDRVFATADRTASTTGNIAGAGQSTAIMTAMTMVAATTITMTTTTYNNTIIVASIVPLRVPCLKNTTPKSHPHDCSVVLGQSAEKCAVRDHFVIMADFTTFGVTRTPRKTGIIVAILA